MVRKAQGPFILLQASVSLRAAPAGSAQTAAFESDKSVSRLMNADGVQGPIDSRKDV